MDENPTAYAEEHKEYSDFVDKVFKDDFNIKVFFGEVVKIQRRHIETEERLVFPLYNYMVDKAFMNSVFDSGQIFDMHAEFLENYDRLLKDHNIISKVLHEALGQSYKIEVNTKIKKILDHMKFEEEVIYPAVERFFTAIVA